MREIELGILCHAIMQNSNVFRGTRDDWGSATEQAYESLEHLAKNFPNVKIKIGIKKRKVKRQT